MANNRKANKTWEEISSLKDDLINNILPSIKETKKELDSYRDLLFEDSENSLSTQNRIKDLETKILTQSESVKDKVQQISDFYGTVFEGGDEVESLDKQIKDYLEEIESIFKQTQEKKISIDSFYTKVFGIEDEEGKLQDGLEKELEKYGKQYQSLFDRIESLLPGATTAGLAKVFSDKVAEYKKASLIWTWVSFGSLFGLTIYYICNPLKAPDITATLMGLLNRLPFIVFAIWLVVFSGNRRAESKKLEESYKHKEVMARSFVGYKEHIEELEESETDKVLLKKHLENLLNSINVNSGDFLDKKGDNSPLHDALNSAGKLVDLKNNIIPKL